MEFPLAHDESGAPLSVPGNASGWLVRKHSGGRGRPAAVYDDDGRPLVVPLESTAGDLRTIGCRPGMYRLDAVDDTRGQLGVTAYTEVRRDGLSLDDGDGAGAPAGLGDAAVAALARAVEAMQRVQAEREKAQADRERAQSELIMRLVERLSPPAPVAAPRNLREVLDEHLDVTKRLDKLAPRDDGDEGGDDSVLERLQPTLEKVVGMVELALARKFGAAMASADPDSTPAIEEESSEGEAQATEPAKSTWTAVEIAQRMNQVEAKLSPAERNAVQIALRGMSREVTETVTQRLMTVSVDQAVAEIRRLLQGGASTNGERNRGRVGEPLAGEAGAEADDGCDWDDADCDGAVRAAGWSSGIGRGWCRGQQCGPAGNRLDAEAGAGRDPEGGGWQWRARLRSPTS